MKKILALPLFAMAAMVSQAWGQSHCCWEGNSYNNNKGYCGPVTSGGSSSQEGTAAYCTANYGTLMNGCSGCDVGSGDKDDSQTCDGYCKWDTGCTSIKTDPGGKYGTATSTCSAAIANCENNASRYSDASCTNFVGGKDPNRQPLGCCKWETESGCYTIWSSDAGADGKVSDCNGGDNKFWSGKCPTEGTCPTTSPVYPPSNNGNPGSSSSGNTPIINNHVIQGLTLEVAPFSRSLYISSAKEATVSLYDMTGARIYSGKVRAGNSVFGLEKVPSGSYYAIVQSGSDSKKVSVMLK